MGKAGPEDTGWHIVKKTMRKIVARLVIKILQTSHCVKNFRFFLHRHGVQTFMDGLMFLSTWLSLVTSPMCSLIPSLALASVAQLVGHCPSG